MVTSYWTYKDLKVNTEKEKCFFDTFDTEELARIVETQKKIADHMKSQSYKKYIRF